MYHKESGIRIRGEIVEVWKDELQRGSEKEQIAAIADGFSAHFLYKGFQTAYGVFDKGASYNVVYAINPVSYGDGSKYRHNNNDILAEQFECLQGVIAKVTDSGNMPEGCSFDGYEYY